jgi:glucosamine 6-phosphate synthetase-like amidotransferase/phosphosugar isomerase protein
MEEPQAIRTAIMQDEQLFTQIAIGILRARQVVISACGTSRYAALVGRCLFSEVASKFCDVVMEAKSREAFTIGVSDIEDKLYDCWIEIHRVDSLFYPLLSIAPLHLLAYYLAAKRGKDPEKPRNLAKSVTVK